MKYLTLFFIFVSVLLASCEEVKRSVSYSMEPCAISFFDDQINITNKTTGTLLFNVDIEYIDGDTDFDRAYRVYTNQTLAIKARKVILSLRVTFCTSYLECKTVFLRGGLVHISSKNREVGI